MTVGSILSVLAAGGVDAIGCPSVPRKVHQHGHTHLFSGARSVAEWAVLWNKRAASVIITKWRGYYWFAVENMRCLRFSLAVCSHPLTVSPDLQTCTREVFTVSDICLASFCNFTAERAVQLVCRCFPAQPTLLPGCPPAAWQLFLCQTLCALVQEDKMIHCFPIITQLSFLRFLCHIMCVHYFCGWCHVC